MSPSATNQSSQWLDPEHVQQGKTSDLPTIFVSIASYRDSQCQYTILDLFRQARHPERIVVGVCHQVAKEDEECFLLDLDAWSPQIRTYFLCHDEAKGPCFARALIQQELMGDEDYYFQVDSHFRFVPGWDQLLLEQLAACPSPRPVLTSLQSAYELPRDQQPGEPDTAVMSRRETVTVLCADKFGDECPGQDDAFLRIKSRVCRTDFGHLPPPALFWTARFHFSRMEAARECLYDPYLDYIFFGEEISMAARLFTSGWDLFNPTKTIGYHLQSRFHRPFYTEVQVSELSLRRHRYAKARLYKLLGDERYAAAEGSVASPSLPYGLGTARTLAEYEKFCGVRFVDHTVSDHARRGGVATELLAPSWAEEARNELLSAKCFTDPEVWAGKGNADALARQFPDVLVKRGPPVELLRARELAKARVQELVLQGSQMPSSSPEVLLSLSRAWTHLGQVCHQVEDRQEAERSYQQALQLVAEAECSWLTDDDLNAGIFNGFLSLARAAALGGLGRFDEAKAAAAVSLAAVSHALGCAEDPPEAVEHLALDAVCLSHRFHEQTEDRAGLGRQCGHFRSLLHRLPRCTPASTARIAVLSDDAPPDDHEETIRARLLEALLLSMMASGTDEGELAAREVFTGFPEALCSSACLQRQLGLMQAGGLFLDLGS
ncbi:unnamed protein product [Polarella glacialis]|uniref:Uncharacterized protein n=1 Tax=Polarella glacialis TaxID=89957 RepID=A0A813JK96_POLGL|nr:unnamed protein product [Polarella glacialis]